MADKSSQLVLTALTRAAADAAGVPLHGSKSHPGLFPATAVGKQAAQRCCDDGLLAVAADSPTSPASYTITDKGLGYLLRQMSPREVLEDFVRVIEAREEQVRGLLAAADAMQQSLAGLRDHAGVILTRLTAGGTDLKALFFAFHHPVEGELRAEPADPGEAILSALAHWSGACSSEDFPLPELYRQVGENCPGLSIGSFHDALRRLVQAGQIYLHPWTGPLYDIPDPPYALLTGHEIAYYASLRDGGP